MVNSEKVEILTRDASALGQVIKTEPQQRFADYEIEPFNRTIVFKAPVSSFDSNLNPRFIRVTYEVDQGGNPFWIVGLDGLIRVNDRVSVGASLMRDRNPLQPLTVFGLSLVAKMGEHGTLTAELAGTDRHGVAGPTGLDGRGGAGRLAYRHDNGQGTQFTASVARTGEAFDNPSASLQADRVEAKALGRHKIDDRFIVAVEATRAEDTRQQNERSALSLKLEDQLGPQRRLIYALNSVDETVSVAQGGLVSDRYTSVGLRYEAPLPVSPGTIAFVEAEQALTDGDRRLLAVGAEHRTAGGSRIYGRYELVSDMQRLANPLTDTRPVALVGAELPYSADGRAFSEYRARDGVDGPAAEAAIGLRHVIKLNEDWRLTGGFERVEPLRGSPATSTTSTAWNLGLEYLNHQELKYAGRVEVRASGDTNAWLIQQGLVVRHNPRFISLGKLYWSEQDTPTAGQIRRWRVLTGFAFRDHEQDDLNWLARVERRHESNPTASTPFVRDVWIAGLHVNHRVSMRGTFTQHWAYKWAHETFGGGLRHRSRIGLVFMRYTHDLTDRLDLGVHGGVMWQNGLSNRHLALGVEGGYLLSDGVWVSLGYNRFGFRDPDLSGSDYTQRGAYLRLRWKFDENLFRRDETPAATAP